MACRFSHGLVMTVLLFVACDGRGPTVEVSGVVTLDGKPFHQASIWFISPRSGAGFSTNLDSDGSYWVEVRDVKLGETYGVFLGPRIPEAGEESRLDEAGNPEVSLPPVPAKYLEAVTSGLVATIENARPHTFDFELKSK